MKTNARLDPDTLLADIDFEQKTRILNCLECSFRRKMTIETIRDLSMLKSTDVLCIRNMGDKCYQILCDIMKKAGVSFAEDSEIILCPTCKRPTGRNQIDRWQVQRVKKRLGVIGLDGKLHKY